MSSVRRHVVIIGAGETSELVARALHERGVATFLVANRRADRARALAERFGGSVASFDELPGLLERADIVLASTSSPHPIVGVEELELVMAARDGPPAAARRHRRPARHRSRRAGRWRA